MRKPDYTKENYCIGCGIIYQKDVIKCDVCKRKVRTTPRNKTATINGYKPVSRTQAIKDSLNYYLDRGLTEKMDIYTKVVDDLGIARPIVRRVARELRSELLKRVQILQGDFAGLRVNQQ